MLGCKGPLWGLKVEGGWGLRVSYSFVQVDGVFARDHVGDGGAAGGGLLGCGGLGFGLLGRHRDCSTSISAFYNAISRITM